MPLAYSKISCDRVAVVAAASYGCVKWTKKEESPFRHPTMTGISGFRVPRMLDLRKLKYT